MLDLGALEEAQAAVHAVGHARIEERGLDHPALRVAAVEHGHFLAVEAVAHELAHLLDHPLRLGQVGGRLVHPHRLARPLVGAQVLAQALLVVADELVGRIEDVAVAAVVLLQLDLVLHVELAHEVRHVAHARAAEGVDALVVVAHGDHAVGTRHEAARDGVAREHLDPGVLQAVGVLELVDQDVAEAALVVLAHRLVVAQQLVAAQHQFAEVDHAFALALLLVELVELDFLAVVVAADLDVAGAQAVFLGAGDEPLRLLGRIAFVVDVELLHEPLDRRELVLRVEDLEGRRQVRELPVRAQEAVAQAVEGADPHAAHVHGQHRREPGHHFLRGLVGEGHGEDAAGRDLAGLQQPSDAGGEHPGLARAGAREDECVARGQRDRSALLRVQVLQQRQFRGVGVSRRFVKQHPPIVETAAYGGYTKNRKSRQRATA
ncbi:hypothetical protein M2165_000615 [Variovorax sp. TBS-050B]|nr:hypothetical protein [Variovorax sp. TBS-050B]